MSLTSRTFFRIQAPHRVKEKRKVYASIDGSSLRGANDPACLGRDKTLVVHYEQQHRLYELCLNHRTPDRYDRFMRKYGSPLRHRPHVAFELEIPQILQKLLAKNTLAPQIATQIGRASCRERV